MQKILSETFGFSLQDGQNIFPAKTTETTIHRIPEKCAASKLWTFASTFDVLATKSRIQCAKPFCYRPIFLHKHEMTYTILHLIDDFLYKQCLGCRNCAIANNAGYSGLPNSCCNCCTHNNFYFYIVYYYSAKIQIFLELCKYFAQKV